MKTRIILLVAAALAIVAAPGAKAQDSGALVDALVKKGVLTSQEGEEIRSDLMKDYATTSAGKLNVGSYVTQLKLFGDARVRYENRQGTQDASATGAPSNETRVRTRPRYRLRIGAEYKFIDDFAATVRFETSSNSTSTNVTMGDDGAGVGDKTSDALYVGQAFLTWKPSKFGVSELDNHLTFNVGRIPNPFVSTNMIWDDDINPDGISQSGSWKTGDFTLGFTTGQIVYNTREDLSLSTPATANGATTMLGWQANIRYNWANKSYVDINPTLYNYVGKTGNIASRFTGASAPYTGGGNTTNNDLLILDVPISVVLPVYERPLKFFADVAYNFEAGARKDAAINTLAAGTYRTNLINNNDDEAIAWRIGLDYGQTKAKGDWLIGGFYGETGLFSVDDTLNDSDVSDGGVNFSGFVFYAAYQLTDNITAKVTYNHSNILKSGLPTGNNGDTVGTSGLDDYQLVQVDLSWKF